jgi:lysozyme family protein
MADYRRQIGFIKKWEGGLSNDPNDPASAYPMPCYYAGQTGWHTNKGITWQTFSSYAGSLNYAATCENFVLMPDYIWLKIFKKKFWDAFLLDTYNSQSIADIVVSWAWGSGMGGAYRQLAKFLNGNYATSLAENKSDYNQANVIKIRDVFNALTRRGKRENLVQQELIEHYRNFYISLNKPYYINGWLNRLDELDSFTQATLREASVKWPVYLFIGAGLVAATIGTVYLIEEYNFHKQRKRAA